MLTTVMVTPNLSLTTLAYSDLPDIAACRYITKRNRKRAAEIIANFTNPNRRDWQGGLTGIDSAIALLNDGWPEGANQAAALVSGLASIVPPPRDTRRRMTWGDDGMELSVDRALSGQWENAWRVARRQVSPVARVVSLACDFGGTFDKTHAELFWAAAQMIVATDALENAGYAVELHARNAAVIVRNRKCVMLDILVKSADQPLRPDVVAAVFGHAGLYRSVAWLARCSSPFAVPDSMGTTCETQFYAKVANAYGHLTPADCVLPLAYDIQTATANLATALTQLTTAQANV